MNLSYLKKANWRDRYNIESFCKTFGVGMGHTFMFTLTFKDNITDKKEASALSNLLVTHIRKVCKQFFYIAVAERQQRGSWHFHFICSCPVHSLLHFKTMVRDFISRSSKPFGFIHAKWTTGRDYKGVALYLTKYLTKSERREKGIRYISCSQKGFNRTNTLFSWAGGVAQLWRLRCAELDSALPFVFKFFYQYASYDDRVYAIKTLFDDYKSFFDLHPIEFICSWVDRHGGTYYKYFADLAVLGRCHVEAQYKYIPVVFRGRIVDYRRQFVGVRRENGYV